MSRIAVQEDGAGGGDVGSDGNAGTVVRGPEDAMMGRMGILVVCRFERLLVEEQVSRPRTGYFKVFRVLTHAQRYDTASSFTP